MAPLRACLGALLAFVTVAIFARSPAAAQSTPRVVPTLAPVSTPPPFSVSGAIRAYDFHAQNAAGFPSTKQTLNLHSLNFAGLLHLNYRFGQSGFSAGVSYFYANPLDGCNDPRSTALTCLALSGSAAAAHPNHLNPVPDVPGYGFSTFYETYVEYQKYGLDAKIGDQVLNDPWANGADARLKPFAYQGADVSYALDRYLTVEMIDVTRFQPRVSSDWLQSTDITGGFFELPHTANPPANTGGFQSGRLGYASGDLTTNLHFYHFENIANLAWLDGKYTFSHEKRKPWIAIQAGDERNAGSAVVGQVDAQAYGLQIGTHVTRNLALTAAGDVIPHRVATLTQGSCTVGTGQITPTQTYPSPSSGYYVGTAVPQCFANPNGTYSLAYGGIASPYTATSDPLFTTSITQGLIDRGAGSSEKLALTYTSDDKRLVVLVSKAWYDYGFDNFPDQATELDADATYHMNAMRAGPYKGLMLRFRYGVRTDDHSAAINYPGMTGVYFGSLPYVEFNRAMLEYDF